MPGVAVTTRGGAVLGGLVAGARPDDSDAGVVVPGGPGRQRSVDPDSYLFRGGPVPPMSQRAILVGTGGRGGAWATNFIPPFVEDGAVEVVAAADIDPEAHVNAREGVGVPAERCYTDATAAFEHDAEFCVVAVPPAAHESVVTAAVDAGLDVLCEKPIADSLEAAVRVAERVEAADARMGVTMSHRFDRDKTALRRAAADAGPLDYLVCRFTCNRREYGAWGEWRYDIDQPLLIEGGIHQIDYLCGLADARPERVYARTWNPEHSDFAGDAQALVTIDFEDGTRALYEGAKAAAASRNCWGEEYVRAECRDATLVLDRRELERFPVAEDDVARGDGERVGLPDDRERWKDRWLLEQFLAWREGGDPMPTNVEDNLWSTAVLFGAIESSATGQPVSVPDLLAETRETV